MLVKGKSQTVTFDKALVVDGDHPTLMVKKATVFWDYDNVSPDLGNNKITKDGTARFLEAGHYTYEGLQEYLKKDAVTLKLYPWTGKVKLVSPMPEIRGLHKMGELLGFGESEVFTKDAKIGDKPADINGGLRYVNVSCSLVDSSLNFYSGARSSSITSLPVGGVTLGKVQTYHDMESVVPITKGTFNQLQLDVTDQIMT